MSRTVETWDDRRGWIQSKPINYELHVLKSMEQTYREGSRGCFFGDNSSPRALAGIKVATENREKADALAEAIRFIEANS